MDTQVVSRESIASSGGGGGGGADSCARCPVLERERDDAVTKNVTLLAATKKPGAGWASTVEGLHGRSKGAARCGIALFGKLSEKPLQSDDSDDGEDEEALDHRPRRAAATAAKVSLGARSASRSDETHRSNVRRGTDAVVVSLFAAGAGETSRTADILLALDERVASLGLGNFKALRVIGDALCGFFAMAGIASGTRCVILMIYKDSLKGPASCSKKWTR